MTKAQTVKVKHGKFNITIKVNNKPSEHAIKRTNSKVNELMYEVYKRDRAYFKGSFSTLHT